MTDPHAYDAPPEFEGENQGLVEALAERLWTRRWELQGRMDRNPGSRFRGQSEVVKASWRKTAQDALGWLGSLGFTGPGGPPREGGQYVYGWCYDANDWVIYDRDRGCVAICPNEQDVPMIVQAPVMAEAIRALLARAQERGGIKRSDLAALEATLPPVPPPPPEPVPPEPTLEQIANLHKEHFCG